MTPIIFLSATGVLSSYAAGMVSSPLPPGPLSCAGAGTRAGAVSAGHAPLGRLVMAPDVQAQGLLERLLERTGARLVAVGAWRLSGDLAQLRAQLEGRGASLAAQRLIDCAPHDAMSVSDQVWSWLAQQGGAGEAQAQDGTDAVDKPRGPCASAGTMPPIAIIQAGDADVHTMDKALLVSCCPSQGLCLRDFAAAVHLLCPADPLARQVMRSVAPSYAELALWRLSCAADEPGAADRFHDPRWQYEVVRRHMHDQAMNPSPA